MTAVETSVDADRKIGVGTMSERSNLNATAKGDELTDGEKGETSLFAAVDETRAALARGNDHQSCRFLIK